MGFLPGKVPTEVLEKIVFKNLGAKRNDVVLSPSIGEDAALVKAGNEILAISTDPITGAEEWLGWLAVHVSANDIATRGIQPRWFNSIILLPKNSTTELIEKICTQMDKAACQLNIAITGGHCEITPGIEHPIVTGCAVGVAENGKYVTTSGARINDRIILTKGTGIEGTAILASDKKLELLKVFDESFVKKAEKFFEKISVVKDALTAFRTEGVTAMHDPTEGGVAGGLHELADAANVGFQVYEEKIFIPEETRKICAHFEIEPLQLISSGSLLIIAEDEKTDEIISRLSKNDVQASIIGEVVEPRLGRNFVTKTGEKTELTRPASDHLWTAIANPVKTHQS
ncbi:MAG: AIR synthase family protein [Candidatus Bathyarchaeum sp.]|nr:MAG: AIR synthase family protein [Candidatus Bathyarchaeum sp.]